jgi:hypothetical protein
VLHFNQRDLRTPSSESSHFASEQTKQAALDGGLAENTHF